MLITKFNSFITQRDTKQNIAKVSFKGGAASTANTVLLPIQTKKSK
jgi:hypothetical protein